MNGLSVFQIKVNKKYNIMYVMPFTLSRPPCLTSGCSDFDNDLRTVMKRAGCKGERICFIFDEGNVLDSAFLERMNALLAAGEVPGLFEGDDYSALMHACREAAAKQSVLLNTEEELYRCGQSER
jgi:dynein heavy chain 1